LAAHCRSDTARKSLRIDEAGNELSIVFVANIRPQGMFADARVKKMRADVIAFTSRAEPVDRLPAL